MYTLFDLASLIKNKKNNNTNNAYILKIREIN